MQLVEGDHWVACHFPLVPVAVPDPRAAASTEPFSPPA